MFKKKNVWLGLSVTFAALLTASIGTREVLESQRSAIDSYLKTQSRVVVSDPNSGEKLYSTYVLDDQYRDANGHTNTDALVSAHKDIGERIEEEGAVLLKNTASALPLKGKGNVTLLGLKSAGGAMAFGATAGPEVASDQNVDLATALTERGFSVNPTMKSVYDTLAADTRFVSKHTQMGQSAADAPNMIHGSFSGTKPGHESKYIPVEPTLKDLESVNANYVSSFDHYKDAAIVVVGRPTAESGDYYPGATGVDQSTGARNALALTDDERAIIKLAEDKFDKVIVLVNTNSPMEIEELKDDEKVDAMLWIGHPGNYGTYGIADILSGEANPSGALPDTYASDSTSSPAMRNFGVRAYSNPDEIKADASSGTSNPGDYFLIEAEGIYTGYKYYETRYFDAVQNVHNASSKTGAFDSKDGWNYGEEVTYSFGYGSSYTTFSKTLDSLEVSKDHKTATAKITVKNTGKVAGKTPVELFVQVPYIEGGVEKSAIQLANYSKTKELAAGESQTVEIKVDMQNVASYDEKTAKTWILDAGTYFFAVGNGAHDALNNILRKRSISGADGEGEENTVLSWTLEEKDDKTSATSKAGASITNRLDNADWNFWGGEKVTYLSRRDWEGTWPKEYDKLAATQEMFRYLNNNFYDLHTDDDVSNITWNAKNGLTFSQMKNKDFDDPSWDLLLDQLDLQEACNFITYGNRNYHSMESIGFAGAKLTENGPVGYAGSLYGTMSNSQNPYCVGEDDKNASYKTNTLASPTTMAATWNKELLHEVGVLWGNDSLVANLPVLWAPSINLHRTPYNGRSGEYFSEDPVLTGTLALEETVGAKSKGLIVTVKHFAFNDQESNRDDVSPYMTEQKARENELRGFQITFEGDKRGKALAVMTGFNRVGPVYDGAHTGLMQNILRQEFGFKGYAVSDYLAAEMTFKEAVLAGTTNFDGAGYTNRFAGGAYYWTVKDENGNPVPYVTDDSNMFAKDANMQKAIRQAMHYSLYTLSQSNMMNGYNATTHTEERMTWWRATAIGLIAGTATGLGVSVIFYAVTQLKPVLAKKKEDK
jgi:beta-glucosidase